MAVGCALHPITGTMSCAACRDKLATGFAEYFAPKPTREQLRQLCERDGYGAIMQLTEQLWAEKARSLGQPGSEHTRGPCAVFMVPCSCVVDAEDGIPCAPCDWCCGSGRVTKRVAEAQRVRFPTGEA